MATKRKPGNYNDIDPEIIRLENKIAVLRLELEKNLKEIHELEAGTYSAKYGMQRRMYAKNAKKYAALGSRIRRARLRSRLNQLEFSKYIGISQSLISLWENGKVRPNKELLIEKFPELKGAPEWKLLEK